MHRKFPKLSPKWQAHYMAKQERLRHQVEKKQAEETKAYKAGMLRINKAQDKTNGG